MLESTVLSLKNSEEFVTIPVKRRRGNKRQRNNLSKGKKGEKGKRTGKLNKE